MTEKTYKPVPRGTKKVMLTEEEDELLKPLQEALAAHLGSSKVSRADATGYLIRHFAGIAAESVGGLDPTAGLKANLKVVPDEYLKETKDDPTESLETLDDALAVFDGLDILNGLLAA
jgi:hypothetical protein